MKNETQDAPKLVELEFNGFDILKELSIGVIVTHDDAAFLEDFILSIPKLGSELVILWTDEGDGQSLEDCISAPLYKYASENLSIIEGEFIQDRFRFDVAKNKMLSYCSRPFILVLDADDRLLSWQSRELAANLQTLSDPRNAGVYGMNFSVAACDYYLGAHCQLMIWQLRLVRNHDKIQFRGAVHEILNPSVRDLDGAIMQTNLIIHHVGYSQNGNALREKLVRNLKLLATEIHETDMVTGRSASYLQKTLHSLAEIDAKRSEDEQSGHSGQ